jgi:pimeloyl-ACP methyl ester carboxylesterase
MKRLIPTLAFLAICADNASATEGVVLLHGLSRSSASLKKIEAALTQAGYVVVNEDYPSHTAPISQLSQKAIDASLADPRLAGCKKIHFITHSLGGLLVRDYLSRQSLPRLGRVVMLGPPNQGSEVVDQLKSWNLDRLYLWLSGPAGQELGTDPESTPMRLGAVNFELGVIAGDRSINWINSLIIPGPDDGKVSVANSRVAGMKDHLVVHATHPMMMRNTTVIEACLRFLKTGAFKSESQT